MSCEKVHILRKPPVLRVTLARSEVRNAVDAETAAALAQAFRQFEDDPELKVAILCGDAGNFCAGADLKAIASGQAARGNRLAAKGDGPMGPTRMQLSKPVIAAVTGYCVAGGLELALWCDLRVAGESAVFGVFCRRFGVPLIDGGTVRLPRLIGQSRALDMILTGRAVGAREALDWGLANRVVPDADVLSAAEQLALEIAALPQTCLRNDRQSSYQQWSLDETAAIRNEFALGMKTLQSGETLAGAARFTGGAGRGGKPT
ncbi:MAG: crotonase/enoyl-CoA hydratase family protein [Pseudomonadota bacterium]|mgnify:CR=1 FL=1